MENNNQIVQKKCLCGQEIIKGQFIRHVQNCTHVRTFVENGTICKLCGENQNHLISAYLHLEKVHFGIEPKEFSLKYEQSVDVDNKDGGKQKYFIQIEDLSETKTETEELTETCPNCFMSFKTFQGMVNHKKACSRYFKYFKKTRDGYFQCKFCPVKRKTTAPIRNHLRAVHLEEMRNAEKFSIENENDLNENITKPEQNPVQGIEHNDGRDAFLVMSSAYYDRTCLKSAVDF